MAGHVDDDSRGAIVTENLERSLPERLSGADYGKWSSGFTDKKTALQADVLRKAFIWRNATVNEVVEAEANLADAIDTLEAHCVG